ncbi:hypothetical protein [Aromatoleum diolicum]|uniref:Uncharacterized protein n=1 Tax=Aromatoleum diolicum TaxID=75796 RepID=A0ABX1QG46_9RHOO|nr:hypothetical protein [Aromatoleum diolicum]NMG77283.1 hypothetical protein [Aromatoleum diolicum]
MTKDDEKQLSLDFSAVRMEPQSDVSLFLSNANVINFSDHVRVRARETSLLDTSPATQRLLQEAKRIPW